MKLFRLAAVLVALLIMASACGDETSVFELKVGDCFDDPGSDVVMEIEILSCDEPPFFEVYYVGDLAGGGTYPSDSELFGMASDLCLPQFEPYVGSDYFESALDWEALWPTEEGWDELDDRGVVCLLYDLSGVKLTGSARNSGL